MYKFRDVDFENYSNENRTELQAQFVSDYTIVSNVSSILFIVLTIFIGRKVVMVKRIIAGLCGALLMFAVTCLFVQIDTDDCKFYNLINLKSNQISRANWIFYYHSYHRIFFNRYEFFDNFFFYFLFKDFARCLW